MKSDKSDPLDDLLAQWQLSEAETPPDFRREVWRRISALKSGPGWFEKFVWWLLRSNRGLYVSCVTIVIAVVWGLMNPPEPEFTPHDAYLISVSPFDLYHVNCRYP